MKISYLGVSERNHNLDSKQRFAEIDCNERECDFLEVELNKGTWSFDTFREGENEYTIYVCVCDFDDYNDFKEYYKAAKKKYYQCLLDCLRSEVK